MKKVRAMNRREFLALSLGGACAVFFQIRRSRATPAPQPRQDLLLARLSGLLRHTESAGIVGRAYVDRYPHEATIPVILALIAADGAGGQAALSRVAESELRTLLDHKIRQDFADERVVQLRGWILSVTEARLCALTALV
jgi:hypothetical protein